MSIKAIRNYFTLIKGALHKYIQCGGSQPLANTHSLHRYSPFFDIRQKQPLQFVCLKAFSFSPNDHLLSLSPQHLYSIHHHPAAAKNGRCLLLPEPAHRHLPAHVAGNDLTDRRALLLIPSKLSTLEHCPGRVSQKEAIQTLARI